MVSKESDVAMLDMQDPHQVQLYGTYIVCFVYCTSYLNSGHLLVAVRTLLAEGRLLRLYPSVGRAPLPNSTNHITSRCPLTCSCMSLDHNTRTHLRGGREGGREGGRSRERGGGERGGGERKGGREREREKGGGGERKGEREGGREERE